MKKIFLVLTIMCILLCGCGKKTVSCEELAHNAIDIAESYKKYDTIDMSYPNWAYQYEQMFVGEYSDPIKDYYYIFNEDHEYYDPWQIIILRMDSEKNAENAVKYMEEYRERIIKENSDFIKGMGEFANQNAINVLSNGVIDNYDEYVFCLLCEKPTEIYGSCVSMIK